MSCANSYAYFFIILNAAQMTLLPENLVLCTTMWIWLRLRIDIKGARLINIASVISTDRTPRGTCTVSDSKPKDEFVSYREEQ